MENVKTVKKLYLDHQMLFASTIRLSKILQPCPRAVCPRGPLINYVAKSLDFLT